ncbi:MFS transporter [Algoriphagus namhaensis]
MKSLSPKQALGIIVLAQFLGTSLWFAGNAAIPQLSGLLAEDGLTAWITSAVQIGFITGTLVFAFFSIPDRFKPSDVFFFCAILGAGFNLLVTLIPIHFYSLLFLRFMVGFFLAGIYPVGMKIAADYFEKGLGLALGLLVGALVLGTALPHLIAGLEFQVSWKLIFWTTSLLAVVGGSLVGFWVPNGPFRKPAGKFAPQQTFRLIHLPSFKSAALGYFGHMWELYTFWAFCPVLIMHFQGISEQNTSTSLLAFSVIGVGGLSCALGGLISRKFGSRQVAHFALAGSGICCLLLAFFPQDSGGLWLIFLLVWGILVTADSPQFSTLVAQSVPAENKGTALTLINSLGFALTIASIGFTEFLLSQFPVQTALSFLVIGPVMGIFLFSFWHKRAFSSGGQKVH